MIVVSLSIFMVALFDKPKLFDIKRDFLLILVVLFRIKAPFKIGMSNFKTLCDPLSKDPERTF